MCFQVVWGKKKEGTVPVPPSKLGRKNTTNANFKFQIFNSEQSITHEDQQKDNSSGIPKNSSKETGLC